MSLLTRRNQTVRPTNRQLRVLTASVAVAFWLSSSPAVHGSMVTDAFIEAVAQIESGGGRQTKGDGGKANGWWQMHEAAWADTTAFRKRKGWPVWSYEHAHDPVVARLYARDYLKILENQLRNVNGECVTMEMVYAAYNMGFGRFQSRGFAIENAPTATREACSRLSQLVTNFEKAKLSADLAKAD